MREEFMIPVILFLSTAAVIISFIISRHKERMAMLEKGLKSEEIKALYTKDYHWSPLSSLKWGILFIMGGLAVLAGYELRRTVSFDEGVTIGGIVPLFLGVGLLIFYVFASKKHKDE